MLACFQDAGVDSELYRFDEAALSQLVDELEGLRNGQIAPKPPFRSWAPSSGALLAKRKAQLAQIRRLGPRHEHLVQEVERWVLLFEIDSDPEADLCFWDAWSLQIVIRRDDLASRRFDRTRAKLSGA